MLSSGLVSTSDTAIVSGLRDGDQDFATDQIKKVSAGRKVNAGVGAADGAISRCTLAVIGALFPGYDTLYRAP